MRTILPRDLLDFDESEIRLIDQRGRLECVAGTLVTYGARPSGAAPHGRGSKRSSAAISPRPHACSRAVGRARDCECAFYTCLTWGPGCNVPCLGRFLKVLTFFAVVPPPR